MGIRVGIGFSRFGFESARAFWRTVERCEASRIDSLWQTDRLSPNEPYLEAMSAMAAIAGATDRIKFGMNAVVLPLRDPLVLARECATIDFLSGGRLLPVFGVGGGNIPEWKATGRDPGGRGRQANEALQLLRRLWSEDRVRFDGEFYRYEDARVDPKPVQRPLPLWVGGNSKAAIRRTARYGTGWLGGITPPGQVGPVIRAIRQACDEFGTHIADDHYGASIPFRFGSWDDPELAPLAKARQSGAAEIFVVGDAAAMIERVREYVAGGASKFVMLPLAQGADVDAQIERLVEEVLPAVEAPGFGGG